MRRTLASPNFATSSNSPPAICGEVLSASISTARRGNRSCSAFMGTSGVVAIPGILKQLGRFRKSHREAGRGTSALAHTLENGCLSAACEGNKGVAADRYRSLQLRYSFVDEFNVSLGRIDSTKRLRHHDHPLASRRSAR